MSFFGQDPFAPIKDSSSFTVSDSDTSDQDHFAWMTLEEQIVQYDEKYYDYFKNSDDDDDDDDDDEEIEIPNPFGMFDTDDEFTTSITTEEEESDPPVANIRMVAATTEVIEIPHGTFDTDPTLETPTHTLTMIEEEPHPPADIRIDNDDTPPTTIEEAEDQQQQTRHTQSKDWQVPVIMNNNMNKNKKKKKQKKATLKMTHMPVIIEEDPRSPKKKKKQATPPKTRSPPNTRSPLKTPLPKTQTLSKRNPPKTLEEGLTYVFSTIAELTDENKVGSIAGMLVEGHLDDDIQEFIREAMPNARAGAVICERLFGLIDRIKKHQTEEDEFSDTMIIENQDDVSNAPTMGDGLCTTTTSTTGVPIPPVNFDIDDEFTSSTTTNPPKNMKIWPTSKKKKKQQKKAAPPKTRSPPNMTRMPTIIKDDNDINEHQVMPKIIEYKEFTMLDVIEEQERKKKKK